jgi:hypothetical protein
MGGDNNPLFRTPQVDIDRCLAIEASVAEDERALYLECMDNIPLSTRVKSPRPLDAVGRDVRDGCILTGVFVRCRETRTGGGEASRR